MRKNRQRSVSFFIIRTSARRDNRRQREQLMPKIRCKLTRINVYIIINVLPSTTAKSVRKRFFLSQYPTIYRTQSALVRFTRATLCCQPMCRETIGIRTGTTVLIIIVRPRCKKYERIKISFVLFCVRIVGGRSFLSWFFRIRLNFRVFFPDGEPHESIGSFQFIVSISSSRWPVLSASGGNVTRVTRLSLSVTRYVEIPFGYCYV